MKLRKDDKVVVILGRDKGKSGKILAVLPKTNKIVVENLNIAKRHTKPSRSQPAVEFSRLPSPSTYPKSWSWTQIATARPGSATR